ncbi:hypothetical protein LguiA_006677 [Lonicera macranthoides]
MLLSFSLTGTVKPLTLSLPRCQSSLFGVLDLTMASPSTESTPIDLAFTDHVDPVPLIRRFEDCLKMV